MKLLRRCKGQGMGEWNPDEFGGNRRSCPTTVLARALSVHRRLVGAINGVDFG